MMEPRLSSSKKWTNFPKEYLEQIQSVFNENFAQYLSQAEVLIEGRIYPEEILFRAGYLENGRIKQANFEFSVTYDKDEDGNALDRIHLCVDAAGTLLMDYLEANNSEEYPLSWKELQFEKDSLFFKFSSENSRLEEEANRLLGEEFLEMINEDSEASDALDHADIDPEISPDPEDWTSDTTGEDDDSSGSNKKRQLH